MMAGASPADSSKVNLIGVPLGNCATVPGPECNAQSKFGDVPTVRHASACCSNWNPAHGPDASANVSVWLFTSAVARAIRPAPGLSTNGDGPGFRFVNCTVASSMITVTVGKASGIAIGRKVMSSSGVVLPGLKNAADTAAARLKNETNAGEICTADVGACA